MARDDSARGAGSSTRVNFEIYSRNGNRAKPRRQAEYEICRGAGAGALKVRQIFDFGSDDEFNKFLEEFQHESDRAAAVLAAAYLDELLKQLLERSFVSESETCRRLL